MKISCDKASARYTAGISSNVPPKGWSLISNLAKKCSALATTFGATLLVAGAAFPAAAQAEVSHFIEAAPTIATDGSCTAAAPTSWTIWARFAPNTGDLGGTGDYFEVYLLDAAGTVLSGDIVYASLPTGPFNAPKSGSTGVNPVGAPFRAVIYDLASPGPAAGSGGRIAVGANISTGNAAILDTITFNPHTSDPDCPNFDDVPPFLTAFGRNTPTTPFTNADTLIFDITFSESVTGADVSDFAITGTTATASGVLAGSGSSYRLTITGGDLAGLNGTVGLNLNSGHFITDTAGNALPTTEPATDLTFTLDNTAPSGYSASIDAAIINAANASSVSFSFSGAEIGAAFTYSLTDSLAASIRVILARACARFRSTCSDPRGYFPCALPF